MNRALRKFTVIFLVILQCIAPLVHAHTGEKNSSSGLHVPGLEMYGVNHDNLEYQGIVQDVSADGYMVSVDSGIRDKKVTAIETTESTLYLNQAAFIFNPARTSFSSVISPPPTQSVYRLLIPSLFARAPPVQ